MDAVALGLTSAAKICRPQRISKRYPCLVMSILRHPGERYRQKSKRRAQAQSLPSDRHWRQSDGNRMPRVSGVPQGQTLLADFSQVARIEKRNIALRIVRRERVQGTRDCSHLETALVDNCQNTLQRKIRPSARANSPLLYRVLS
jgi:hypothetical protein